MQSPFTIGYMYLWANTELYPARLPACMQTMFSEDTGTGIGIPVNGKSSYTANTIVFLMYLTNGHKEGKDQVIWADKTLP